MLFVLWSCEYVKFLDWRVIVCKDGILVIIQVVLRDVGKYVCIVSSVGGVIRIIVDMNFVVVYSKWEK